MTKYKNVQVEIRELQNANGDTVKTLRIGPEGFDGYVDLRAKHDKQVEELEEYLSDIVSGRYGDDRSVERVD